MTETVDPTIYLDGIVRPRKGAIVIDPFTGDGAMMKWIGNDNIKLMYDDEQHYPGVIKRQPLSITYQWGGAFIVSRLPTMRKSVAEADVSKADAVEIMNRWGTDDLYKCFIKSLLRSYSLGGVIILPLEFLTSYRNSDTERRTKFFQVYYIKRANVFTDHFLPNTTHLPMAIEFYRRDQTFNEPAETRIRTINVHIYPSNKVVSWSYDCAAYYCPLNNPLRDLPEIPPTKFVKVRYVNLRDPATVIKPSETLTNIANHHCDTSGLHIMAVYVDDVNVACKHKWRLVVRGIVSKKLQKRLAIDMTNTINKWRNESGSLFMSYAPNPEDTTKPAAHLSIMLIEKLAAKLIYSYSQTEQQV